MEFTAKTIAEFLHGELVGNPDVTVTTASKIEEGKEGTISFLANPKYMKYLYTTEASIVIVNRDFEPEQEVECTLIKVDDAYQAFASLLELQNQAKPVKTGIDSTALVAKSAKTGKEVYLGAYTFIGEHAVIGDHVKIYPQVYVGDHVEIGDHTIIYPGVKIYENSKIGKDCVIHSGTVIGSDGFGFAPRTDQDYKKVPQIGNVVIEDLVEIGANTAIDRATIGSTIIRRGVKLDNLIQVAHNVEIGENTVIAAQTGISGSARVGKNCMFGGQVGLAGHLTIADEVKIGAQAGVPSSIEEPGKIIQGTPAQELRQFQRSSIVFRRLPDLKAKIDELEKELNALKNK